ERLFELALMLLAERQKHFDPCAAAGGRLERDHATVQLRKALDDGESEPRAAMSRAMRAAFEAIEHGLLIILRNAHALVLHAEAKHGILPPAIERNSAALLREADGVREEIIQHLGHASAVGNEAVDAQLNADRKVDIVLL